MKVPKLIPGGSHTDHRGMISFVNDFSLSVISRFYVITQSPENGPRAWQGHKEESKYFYCSQGSFLIKLVRIDHWDNPSDVLEVDSFLLSSDKSEVLAVPGGYANGLLAKEKGSQLIVFSERSVEDAIGDEFRYDKSNWVNWELI